MLEYKSLYFNFDDFFFQIPLLVKLFDKLYSLTNLLVVQPENLKQVCSEEQLVRACMRACARAPFSACVWAYMLYLFALYLSRVMGRLSRD